MKTKEEIEKRIEAIMERLDFLTDVYNKLMLQIENCPNQFENKEYQMLTKELQILNWVLS